MKDKYKNFIEKNKKDMYVFIGMLLFSIILCTNFLKIHFAQDTYCLYASGYKDYMLHFLRSARFFSALELLVSRILDITLLTNLRIISIMGILFIAIAWFVLYKFIIKLIKKEKSIYWNILIAIITFSILYNFASCELFIFAESGIMCLSILFAVIAACVFNSDIKHRYLISFIFVFLSSISYQATISVFVILALIMEAYKNKGNTKKVIGEAILIGIFYGGALALNLAIIKVIDHIFKDTIRPTAILTIQAIIDTIKKYGTIMAVDTFKVLPKYFYLIIIGIITVWYVINNLKNKDLFSILEYIILVVLAFIMPLLPVVATAQSQQYLEPRMSFSYASITAGLILYIALMFDIETNNINKKIAIIFAIGLMILNSMYFIRNSTENVVSGYLDRNVAKSILEEIYEYQNENNIKIENIGIAYDQRSTTYYDGQPSLETTNVRSMVTNWAAVQVLEFYSGETYNIVETPNDVKQKFLEHDWKFYTPEQLVFNGDTLYICLY